METIETLLEKIYNNEISKCTFLGGVQPYKEPNELEKDIITNIKKLKKQYPNSIFICQKDNKLKNTYDLNVIHPDNKLEFSAVYTRRIFNIKYTLEEKYKTFINIWTTNIKRESIIYDFYFIY